VKNESGRALSHAPGATSRKSNVASSREEEKLLLNPGELHTGKRFGPNTVNRGAALFDCEWDGGSFESGMFMGGMFRSGQFAGGLFLGGIFLDGVWTDGIWEGGFDRNGLYHSRGDRPGISESGKPPLPWPVS
jgi:hypothetical protein